MAPQGGMAETLTDNIGPLPTWAWIGGGAVGLTGYLIYKKRKSTTAAMAGGSSADSSNLGSVPISNLVVAAEPMPIQTGDTFINNPPPTVTTPVTINNPPPADQLPPAQPNPAPPSTPSTSPTPPAPAPVKSNNPPGVPSGWKQVPTPTINTEMAKAGVPMVTVGQSRYYNPQYVQHITSATQGGNLVKQGFAIITMNNAQWYNPFQKKGNPQ